MHSTESFTCRKRETMKHPNIQHIYITYNEAMKYYKQHLQQRAPQYTKLARYDSQNLTFTFKKKRLCLALDSRPGFTTPCRPSGRCPWAVLGWIVFGRPVDCSALVFGTFFLGWWWWWWWMSWIEFDDERWWWWWWWRWWWIFEGQIFGKREQGSELRMICTW